MVNTCRVAPLPVIPLDTASHVPLYRQVYEALRNSILKKQFDPGTKLPSTREMARGLMVSRNTIMNAYDQLLAEGYLEGHVGSGTYVTRSIPDEMLSARLTPRRSICLSGVGPSFSKRGEIITTTAVNASTDPTHIRPFWPGIPALKEFPVKLWNHLVIKHSTESSYHLLGYGEPAGYRPLREAIATYLGAARAVQCTPDQVIITSGRQQAFDLAIRILLDAGDSAWVEDPGYVGARAAFIAAAVRLVGVPMDKEGLDIEVALSMCSGARLVMVSPSHQYPLGITMSLSRRLALLEWANKSNAWIIEDDYDSEYRYTGRPLSALQGLDQEGRVIYIGTFSKVMFPALRLGYLVVPPDNIDQFVTARAVLSRFSPVIDQAALADFMREGHFTRHIRRMRGLYKKRQELLIQLLESELQNTINVQSDDAGLHLIAWLPEGSDGPLISSRAAAYGLDAQPLSAFRLNKEGPDALVLGYAGYNEKQIRAGVNKLSRALSEANLRSCA